MKIAIHHREKGFSVKWIEYCENNQIPYKLVNCFDTDIIRQLQDCDGLMWHWSHSDVKAALMARQLTLSLEKAGKKVFPDSNTAWHYDDKLGQKYLLESINAPLVPTYIFYNKKEALAWAANTTYPKVFKTRNGAGSINVRLVHNEIQARKLINKCFGKGIKTYRQADKVKDKIWRFKRDKSLMSFIRLAKHCFNHILPIRSTSYNTIERNYAYFQDFIPNNNFDDRVVVIGNRAIAIRRQNRVNDFRASGSGVISHNPEQFSLNTIKLAFEIAKSLNSQSLAFDFIYDKDFNPMVLEISYAFSKGPAYENCPGFWDQNLQWHKVKVNPQVFIIKDFVDSLK